MRVIACAASLCLAHAASYYISPQGSDANSGTSAAAPWLTTKNVDALTLSAGDQVLFLGGADHTPGQLTLSSGGSPSQPVLIAAYGGGGAAARLHVDASKNAAVSIVNSGGFEIANISVYGNASAAHAAYNGIDVESTTTGSGPRFGGLYIHDVLAANFLNGVSIGAAGCQGFEHVLLQRVTVTGNLITGMQSYGAYVSSCFSHADIVVEDCIAYDNPGDVTRTSGWSGSGIVLSGADGAVITRSVAYGNGFANGHVGGGPVGIWGWDINNLTISHCVSYRNGNGPAHSNDGGGFDLDGGATNSVIEYSLSFENAGPGFLICQFGDNVRDTVNNTVRFSVSLRDGLRSANGATGVNTYTPTTLASTRVYGNTVVGNASDGATAPFRSNSAGVTDFLLTSNAFIAVGSAPIVGAAAGNAAGFNFSGNAYWSVTGAAGYDWDGSTYASLAAWRSGSGEEREADGSPTGMDANPGLNYTSTFFQTCVQWNAVVYPSVPNSPALDALRGFSGC